jgi:hypothetical protein
MDLTYTRVRPLLGGLDAWVAAGYEVGSGPVVAAGSGGAGGNLASRSQSNQRCPSSSDAVKVKTGFRQTVRRLRIQDSEIAALAVRNQASRLLIRLHKS